MKTFEDNEIIKALECCNGWYGRCLNCPLNCEGTNCKEKLNSYALDLINRQKDKIKEFDEKLIIQQGLIDYQKAEIERLNIESETLATQLKGAYEQIHKLKMA